MTRVQGPVKFASTLGRLPGVTELRAHLKSHLHVPEWCLLTFFPNCLEPKKYIANEVGTERTWLSAECKSQECFNTTTGIMKHVSSSQRPTDRTQSSGNQLEVIQFAHEISNSESSSKRPAEKRGPREIILRRITG